MTQEEIQNALDEAVRFCSPMVAQLFADLHQRLLTLEGKNTTDNQDSSNEETTNEQVDVTPVRRGRNN